MMQKCRKERINEAYRYLYDNGMIHTVTDLAVKMRRSRTSVSNALNGNDDYLSDKFIGVFCNTFPNLFNIDWLLTGNGEMLISTPPTPKEEKNKDYILDLIAAKDETIAAKDETIASLKSEIESLRVLVEQQKKQLEATRPKLYPTITEMATPVAADDSCK